MNKNIFRHERFAFYSNRLTKRLIFLCCGDLVLFKLSDEMRCSFFVNVDTGTALSQRVAQRE